MKLEIECSWNNNKSRAMQIVRFDFLPKSVFAMPDEKALIARSLAEKLHTDGPPILDKILFLKEQYPKSLYLYFVYYSALSFFDYKEEIASLLLELQKKFPSQPFTKCIVGNELIKEEKYDEFSKLFNKIEVLKGVFPKRQAFNFEEVLCFHSLWLRYFEHQGDGFQYQKHQKFMGLVVNTYKSLCMV